MADVVKDPKTEVSEEEAFRTALKDTIVIVKKLAPLCKNPADLVGMMELAVENSGQLAMLHDIVSPVGFRQ